MQHDEPLVEDDEDDDDDIEEDDGEGKSRLFVLVTQAGVSRSKAVRTLKAANGDIVYYGTHKLIVIVFFSYLCTICVCWR